jgi:hypothetical protein
MAVYTPMFTSVMQAGTAQVTNQLVKLAQLVTIAPRHTTYQYFAQEV